MKGEFSDDAKLKQELTNRGYTNLSRLGRRVLQAQHPNWGVVTIKYAQAVKHRHFLKQEAEFLYSNSNYNWPEYCDYFSNQQSDYLVLSHICGITLLQIQTEPSKSNNFPTNWITLLERSIHQVHKLGFVHGDIKPSNIVLTPQGQVHLIDFGSVIKNRTLRSELRFESYTPRYSTPGSVLGKFDDWFALAVILEKYFDQFDYKSSSKQSFQYISLPSRYHMLLRKCRS
ncbi:AarF/UbiB family protein [Vibrio sp. 1F279]|uniref:protein kinase domain-containing protein n=1 Tax=unclassified Vibrio TaxID=2614977 RepID=UPI00352D86B5